MRLKALALIIGLIATFLALGSYQTPVAGLLTPPGGGLLTPGGGVQRSGTNVVLINSGDNFGIGTSSPQATLEIVEISSGASAEQLYLSNLDSATSTQSRLTFRANDITNATSTGAIGAILDRNYNSGSSSLAFFNLQAGSLTEAFRIDGSGKLGVGTSTPAQELSVVGDVYVSSGATSTVKIFGTGASGGCLELESPAGVLFRLYATSSGRAYWEQGSCQ